MAQEEDEIEDDINPLPLTINISKIPHAKNIFGANPNKNYLSRKNSISSVATTLKTVNSSKLEDFSKKEI